MANGATRTIKINVEVDDHGAVRKLGDVAKGEERIGAAAKATTGDLNRQSTAFQSLTRAQQDAIQQANLYARASQQLGGAVKLTAHEQQLATKATREALGAYKALGQEAPAHIQKLSTELTGLQKAQTSAAGAQGFLTSAITRFVTAAAIGGAIRSVVNYADGLVRMSQQTGIGVEALQRLNVVAKTSGNTLEQVTGAISRMQDRLAGDDKSAVDGLNRLGLSLDVLLKMKPDEQFTAIGQAIAKIEDPAMRAKRAVDLFGLGGAAILPTLIADFTKLGHVISEEDVKAIDQLGDQVDLLKTRGLGLLAEFIGPFAQSLNAQISSNQNTVAGWLSWLFRDTSSAAFKGGASAAVAGRFGVPGATVPQLGLAGDIELSARQDIQLLADTGRAVTRLGETHGAAAGKAEGAWRRVNIVLDAQRTQAEFLARMWAIEGSAFLNTPTFTLGQMAPLGPGGPEGLSPQEYQQLIGLPSRTTMTAGMFTLPGGVGNMPAPAPMQGFFSGFNTQQFGAQMGQNILGAVMGGGSVIQTVGSTLGVGLGTSLVSSFGGAITGALGSVLGGAVNAILPGVGALVGPLASKLFGALFGPTEWEKNFRAANAEITKLEPQLLATYGGLDNIKRMGALVGVNLADAFGKKGTSGLQNLINLAGQFQAKLALLDSALSRYGLTWEHLGVTARQAKLDEIAKGLLADMEALITAGVEDQVVFESMAGAFSDFVQTAIRTGTDIPEAMRPVLQRFIDLGLLVDATGTKITTLTGISFADAAKSAEDFATSITKIGTAAGAVDLSGTGGFYYKTDPTETQYSHTGGLMTAHGVERFHAGGNVLPFVPRFHDGGSSLRADERLAILQTGEFVTRRASVQQIGAQTMQTMNRTGQLPARGQNVVVNVHRGAVQMHGTFIDRRGLEGAGEILTEVMLDRIDGGGRVETKAKKIVRRLAS